jgi:hypothetical protein
MSTGVRGIFTLNTQVEKVVSFAPNGARPGVAEMTVKALCSYPLDALLHAQYTSTTSTQFRDGVL